MKKILLLTGAMTVMIAGMQSCAPQRKMPRPQRHPTPPGKFVQVQTPATTTNVLMVRPA